MRLVTIAIFVSALLLMLNASAQAQGSINETWIRTWNPSSSAYSVLNKSAAYPLNLFSWNATRSVWSGNYAFEAKGISDKRMFYFEDFLGYSNSTTGIGILASSSAPSNTTIVTPADWCWGSAGTNGTVKLIAGVNGTAVLNTSTTADNDDAILTWREANFDITNNSSLEVYVTPSSLTDSYYEAGWYVDTNDEIVFRFNPATSATKWLIVYEKNNGGEQSITTSTSVSTSAYTKLRIDLLSTGGAKCWINDSLVYTFAASTIRDVAFKPRFYAKSTMDAHSEAKTLTVDYVKIWQDR